MLLLSELLEKLDIPPIYQIENEQDFQYFALTESDLSEPCCVFLDNPKFVSTIKSNVKMVLTTKECAKELPDNSHFGICTLEKPRIVFFQLHNFCAENNIYEKEVYKTIVGENCKISHLAYIAPNNVKIGNNVTIEEFVSIKENTEIGDNTIIRAGTIVGGQGFEFKPNDNSILAVEHCGGVKISKDVELQQNNCVDKAVFSWDNTVIGEYCKTDNFVHIAHGVKMHKRVRIAACTCISGRVTLEDDVWIGPGVTVINGSKVGKKGRVSIGSVTSRDVGENESVTGNFAIEHSKFINFIKSIR
ncbi:hypothetical protein CMETHOX_08360 [Lacrimispora indolis]|nr:hypothetical protein CMETHOX_08360 [[Clostridium] methoxybenzovorans]